MVTEQTQFSMAEFKTFTDRPDVHAEGFKPTGTRETAMFIFGNSVADKAALASIGGLGNVQRVRVLGEAGKPLDQQEVRFEFVAKLPVHILEKKRQEEARAKALAEVERLKADPKALREYVQKVAYAFLERAAVIALLESAKVKKPARKPSNKPVVTHVTRTPKRSPKKLDPFEAALKQDQRNRAVAAKKATAEFHQKKAKAS